MKDSFWISLAAVFLLLTLGLRAAAFDDLLPAKGAEGRLMTIAVSDRIKVITDKMAEAMKKDQEWFIEASKNTPPGAPMNYDERMGITREEYDEFLRLTRQGASLQEVGRFKFDVIANADGSRSFDARHDVPLNGLKFDSKSGVVSTPWGVLKGPQPVEITAGRGALGRWKGMSYELLEGTPEAIAKGGDGKSLKLTIGRQSDTGRRFMIYKAMVVESGVRTAGFEFVIMYD